jgi:hypothetical protein
MEKINSMDLANKTRQAESKIKEGQAEKAGVEEFVNENMDVLAHEASMDYLAKLKGDLVKAVDGDNTTEAERILKDISSHKESMKEYQAKARENVGSYIDNSGVVSMEKFEKELNAFMAETLVIWYGKADAEKAKIKMSSDPLAKMDYKTMLKNDSSKFGEYTINPETAGMNHKEKEPKVKILNEELKQFIGEPRSEVIKFVVENYGADKILGLEYEKYLLENPDKVPEDLKDGNWYYFMGSTLRDQNGNADVPCVNWLGSKLSRDARTLSDQWSECDRVLLLEK